MADVWYLVIRTPAPSIEVWPIGEDACSTDPAIVARTEGYVAAGRAAVGCPEDWMGVEGWDVSMSPGLPHPSLLAQATVHDGPPS